MYCVDATKPKEALKYYQRAARIREKSPEVLIKIARIQLQDLADVKSAMKTLKQVTVIDPTFPEAYYMLGYALKDLNRRSEAKRALETLRTPHHR
ncbi:MAG: tetratricopeptide repeat protein [Myxococcota bacterium]